MRIFNDRLGFNGIDPLLFRSVKGQSYPIRNTKVWFDFRRLAILGFLIVMIVGAFNAFSQSAIVSDYKKVPIPPSPNAAALGKFGDVPVSPNTGVPDISIPIHAYSDGSKNLNLSIQLKYHAGGHKVEDMASNVGLGWALNAGGVIMRTMRGIPDESSMGYIRTPPLPLYNTLEFDSRFTEPSTGLSTNAGICMENAATDYLIIKQIAENTYDGECDLFNISVGNINEKFFFKKNGDVVFITPNNLRVVTSFNTTNNSIDKFTLTDENGVTYTFDVKEQTQTDNGIEPLVPAPPMYVSAWYLSKIQSADKKDEITFQYESTTQLSYEAGFSQNFTSPYQNISNGLISLIVQETLSYNRILIYSAQRIKKILLPNHTIVDFDYTLNREDYAGDKALTSIKLSNNSFEKIFRLNYDYFVSSLCEIGGTNCLNPMPSNNNILKRLKLLSVQEESGTISVPSYVFQYNDRNLPVRYSKNQDWWGYYNGGAVGELINPNLIYPPQNGFIFGRDRIPSLDHAGASLLESIQYPTGGKTTFTYELNQALYNGILKNAGGVRLQKKEDYDPIKQITYQTRYSYIKSDGTSSGNLLTIPAYTTYWNTMLKMDGNGDVALISKFFYLNESLNPTQTLSYNNGRSVSYSYVREEQFSESQSNGYKIYEFTEGQQSQEHDAIYPFIQKQDFSWEAGLPIKQSVYDSSNFLVSTEENVYQITSYTPTVGDSSTRNLIAGNYLWDFDGTPTEYIYGARYYYLTQGKSLLTKVTNKLYSHSGTVAETVTEYLYDNTYFLPTVIKSSNSKGVIQETRNYYPFDYNETIYPLMEQLVLDNRLTEIVSTENWITENGNSFVKSIIVNDYAIVNSNLLKKNKVSSLKTSQPIHQTNISAADSMYRSSQIDEDVLIEEFDSRGRAVQFKLSGDYRYSVIWGDDNSFPIATASNAKFDEVAYTSFETIEKGNWIFSGTPVEQLNSPTGKHVYNVSSPLSKNISSTQKYKLGLWRHGNIAISNATLYRTGETIDNWTYEEYLVENTSVLTITGSGYVDEVRIFPATSEMSSYTYHSPGQVQSQSDKNGTITRYAYDSLGRLLNIKDEDKNVMQSIDYHYKTTGQ